MEQFCPAVFFSKNKNTRFHIPVQIPFWRGADDPENIMKKAMDAAIKDNEGAERKPRRQDMVEFKREKETWILRFTSGMHPKR